MLIYVCAHFVVWQIQKHGGSLLEGFTQTQISTLAVKDNIMVAGGFQGELICKVSYYYGSVWLQFMCSLVNKCFNIILIG